MDQQSTSNYTVICISGKRRSGKDFVSRRLCEQLEARGIRTEIRGISYSLKEEYAEKYGLDAERLKFDPEYKESVRKSMVKFGEDIRNKNVHYFCRKAMESIPEADNVNVVIISDCRRPTDLEFFGKFIHSHFIRIECSDAVRRERGFIFTPGVDDCETECALDSFKFKRRLQNDGDSISLDTELGSLISEVISTTG